ncbi:MAG: hypothetical protein JRI79_00195 [Deltaproteobacteria bacterium]|nr:hypothetical protein [Deltaproteobacteria bacterium]MBW1976375.1 hypothetical protein [Deltaproteobacteria bacterium]MBW2299361.1 hypothetical protein [Deltaproteobacteria bacterium]
MIEINDPPSPLQRLFLKQMPNSESLPRLLRNQPTEGAATKLAGSLRVNTPLILFAIRENVWKLALESIGHYKFPRKPLLLFKILMNDLSLQLFLDQPPELLTKLLDKSGLTWEAKLKKALLTKEADKNMVDELIKGDLKGLALKLLAAKDKQPLALKTLVSAIDNIQLLNHLWIKQKGKIFLPIPIQLQNGLFTVGQLLIQFFPSRKDRQEGRKEKEAKKDFYKVTFLLHFSSLGPLKVDIIMHRKQIMAKFILARKETKSLVERKLPVLVHSIEKKGFAVHTAVCVLREAELFSQSLLEEIAWDGASTINLVA